MRKKERDRGWERERNISTRQKESGGPSHLFIPGRRGEKGRGTQASKSTIKRKKTVVVLVHDAERH